MNARADAIHSPVDIEEASETSENITDKTGKKACARFFIRIYDNYYKSLLEEPKKPFISILFPKRAKIRDVSIQRTWQTEHTFRPRPHKFGYLR